ncbi:MAG TPA: helix-turn-helix transcriptional regulator [Actinomycetota bacterium]|nr:helix-turn-helix transcriptional regulator [Actinomycetota bacterium]
MRRREQLRQARRDVISIASTGLASADLRSRVLAALNKVLPVDAAFFASTDPTTLLFTGATTRHIPPDASQRFLDNELRGGDVNHFVDLARGPRAIDSLDRATAGQRATSPRYREILEPLGLGDELRMAFRSGGTTWGFLCLHREDAQAGFGAEEAAALRFLAPYVTDGLRRAAIAGASDHPRATGTSSPGAAVLILESDLSVAATSMAAERWLQAMLAVDETRYRGLPTAMVALAERISLLHSEDIAEPPGPPSCRVRTAEGWLVLHASLLQAGSGPQIAVVMEPATPHQLAPLYLEAFGLTAREAEVTRLALQGCSGPEIAAALHIGADTVQDHLKAVFTKAGVRNRRELVLAMYGVPAI